MGILLHDIELPNETEGTMVIRIKPGAEKADIQWHAFVGGIFTEVEEVSDTVKHGKWEFEPGCMYCSRCGWIFSYEAGLEEEWNYCPHCGAQMERSEE